ncbi:MAG TPA: 50S ribosomal protein L4 [Candidatus Microsaccharimonas sp.]|nr:50S ribosomal protein L4 [Candidatus Microsaccharimonas sp.]
MSVATFTKSGTKATTAAKLDKSIFGVEVTNHELLKLAYTAYLANGRENLAVTKTRGMVTGSNIKPWKQKGTGRARFGSRYNPIWRGGGIVFGPTGEENYRKELNVKAKRQAIRQALTLAADSGKFIVVETIESKDGKTAELAKLLAKVGASKNTLVVVASKTVELTRATSNLTSTKLVTASYLNVFDILNADSIVVSNDALAAITSWLAVEAKKPAKETK